MADVSFVGQSTGADTSVEPGGTLATDDLILVTLLGFGVATTIPGTFTQLGTDLNFSGLYFGSIAYRIRQVGDGASYSGFTDCIGWSCATYRNVDTTDPFVDSNFATYSANANIPLPSLTASDVAGDGAVYLIQGLSFESYTFATNYTERQDTGSSQTIGDRLSLTASQATSGTVTSGGTDSSFVLHAIMRSTNVGGLAYGIPGFYM